MADLSQFEAIRPASAGFRDARSAAQNLDSIRKAVSEDVFSTLSALLVASPNPETALNQFERLVTQQSREVRPLFEKYPALVHYALVVFGYSPWLGETLIQNPDILRLIARERSLDRSHAREEFDESFARFRSRSLEEDEALLLARFKRREYVRILLRDVLGLATLAETTGEISTLSDLLIEEGLRIVNSRLQDRYGPPQQLDAGGRLVESRFAVLSLGKLGGSELNYSSDIDLLFLYDTGAEEPGNQISNREYFIRVAQQLTELLSRHTPEGPVFRIDLRLRPLGNEGELAVPLSYAVEYYSRVAQDWELQAMIKARHAGGDLELSREFVRFIQRFVYRPEINFAAIKTALISREKIDKRQRLRRTAAERHRTTDVKLDRGGIRDIEFLVQCLQRVYGGAEPWLRSRGTLFSLQKLYDKEHISGSDFQTLTSTYEFLRNVEHRLQLQRGQQTHRLPRTSEEVRILSRIMAREGTEAAGPSEFIAQLRCRMNAVADIYDRIVYQQQKQLSRGASDHLSPPQPPAAGPSSRLVLQRFTLEVPKLGEILDRAELSAHGRRNLDRFLNSSATSPERYRTIVRSPEAIDHALPVFEYSDYLTDILIRHPKELATLVTTSSGTGDFSTSLFTAEQRESPEPSVRPAEESSLPDYKEAMARLRRNFRRTIFARTAVELYQPRDIWQSLSGITAAAELAIQTALAMEEAPGSVAVLALGRLGTGEFDLLSDADLLFVCNEDTAPGLARNTATGIIESLTAYTRDGTVFPVDTRLRPHGGQGELVVTPTQLAAYFEHEAQSWEALTYLKLRFVAGDPHVASRTMEAVQYGIGRLAHRPGFSQQLALMRRRLEKSDRAPNLKTGAGGAYDIDFLAGSLQAEHGLWFGGTQKQRLEQLRDANLLDEGDCRALIADIQFLRTVEHVIRLVSARSAKWIPVAEYSKSAVESFLSRMLGKPEFAAEAELVAAMQRIRSAYWKYRK